MFSRIGKAFVFLTLLVAAGGFGYTAWETQNLRVSIDRMAVGNETNITEMMISLAQTERQLGRIRETVDLLGGSGTGQEFDAAALEGKITNTLTAAQREVLQQELKKWAKQLQGQSEKSSIALRRSLEQKLSRSDAKAAERDKRSTELKALVQQNQKSLTARLKELGDGVSNPSGAIEKRLAAVLKAAEQSQQALNQRNQRDEKQWKDLFLALRENMEATQQRYAELAARLDQRPGGVKKPPATPPAKQPGQVDRGLQDAEREKLLEFCREVPQSALCRDL